ncbi:MAG: hypothetical protein JNM95_09695 [Chitinophagaceae bacterium]|nr:hypothetical protein [Chitinophagaceae bacterium]
MKKVQLILVVTTLGLISFSSCNEYRSFSSVTKVSQLSGNPFYYNLSKGILKHLSGFLVQEGLKGSVGKVNLLSNLNQILTTADQISKFKNLLGSAYQIPATKMNSFNAGGTVKDVVSFVAKNGTKFPF